MTDHSIGIDISKDHLDAYRLIDGQSRRFANDRRGHRALIAWMGSDVVRVVHEPTGPYHRALEQALAAAGLPLVKVIRARRAASSRVLANSPRLTGSTRPCWLGWARCWRSRHACRAANISTGSRTCTWPAKPW